MAIWAIVPVKPLRRGKSRLAGTLPDEDRIALNYCLLENTLDTLRSISRIEYVLVISRDPQALSVARRFQARTIQESGAPDLNCALERATAYAIRSTVQGVLIIPADLPLINTLDVESMLDAAVNEPVVAINPDRHKKGTNALLVSPTGLIKYAFGEDSFQVHCQRAQAAGARLEILDRPGLALDLDLPEDLAIIQQEMQVLNVSNDISLLAESGLIYESADKSCIKQVDSSKLGTQTESSKQSENLPLSTPKMNSE